MRLPSMPEFPRGPTAVEKATGEAVGRRVLHLRAGEYGRLPPYDTSLGNQGHNAMNAVQDRALNPGQR